MVVVNMESDPGFTYTRWLFGADRAATILASDNLIKLKKSEAVLLLKVNVAPSLLLA